MCGPDLLCLTYIKNWKSMFSQRGGKKISSFSKFGSGREERSLSEAFARLQNLKNIETLSATGSQRMRIGYYLPVQERREILPWPGGSMSIVFLNNGFIASLRNIFPC